MGKVTKLQKNSKTCINKLNRYQGKERGGVYLCGKKRWNI